MQLRDLFNEVYRDNTAVIPFSVQQLLREPLNIADDWQRTEALLLTARAAMPEQIEIGVALYKMYAYTNRFDESLSLIQEVLEKSAQVCGINPDWRRQSKETAEWRNAGGAWRWYLYTMKAAGFVSLRKGNLDYALEVLEKLTELDPLDSVGGSVVYEMATRLTEDDA